MEYGKPKVIIDLDEYLELKRKAETFDNFKITCMTSVSPNEEISKAESFFQEVESLIN